MCGLKTNPGIPIAKEGSVTPSIPSEFVKMPDCFIYKIYLEYIYIY